MDEDIYLSNPDAGTIDVLGGALSGRTWGRPAITPDGRYIALATEHAHDPSDTDGLADIYVYDTLLDTYEAVSVTPSGTLSADFSSEAAISDDGRFVAFESEAADLVPGDTNGFDDVFVRDRLLGTTTRVSVASDGTQSDEESLEPAISADGRYVVFSSKALLAPMPFPGTAGVRLIYRHDLQTSETILISVDNSGRGPNEFCEEGTISDDGNLVTFGSYATNWWNGTLVEYDQIYVRDIAAGTTTMLSGATPGFALESESDTPSISRDGTSVVFSAELSLHPDDTNDDLDVYRTTTTPIMDWTYLGGELAGDARPLLSARGYFTAGADAMLDVRQAAPSASMGLVLGLARIDAPFKGGALIPSPDLLVFGTTDTDGAWVWPFVHPNNVAAGIELFVQAAVQDVGAPAGWALSNGVRGLSR
jgi:Tol biopolymer transport system component